MDGSDSPNESVVGFCSSQDSTTQEFSETDSEESEDGTEWRHVTGRSNMLHQFTGDEEFLGDIVLVVFVKQPTRINSEENKSLCR